MAYGKEGRSPFGGIFGVGLEFLKWWEYYDGRYLLKGVDLYELLSSLDSNRAFNLIDTIVADEIIENDQSSGTLREIRIKINKIHGKMGKAHSAAESSKMVPPTYVEPTDQGYPGFLPPLG